MSSGNNKYFLDNMIIYYSVLFETDVDMETDCIVYNDILIETIEVLNKKLKERNHHLTKFILDILIFNLNFIKSVKKIS